MKKLESDVVVVGGGTAALPVAIAAAQSGASVSIYIPPGILMNARKLSSGNIRCLKP